MTTGKFQDHIDAAQDDLPIESAPLGGTKAEATQRLQIGFFGLGSMVLLIGLATIIGNQADLTQESSVPEAAPTTEPVEVPQQRDPLADAGIVPDIPTEPTEALPEEVQDLPEGQAVEDLETGDGQAPLGDDALQE